MLTILPAACQLTLGGINISSLHSGHQLMQWAKATGTQQYYYFQRIRRFFLTPVKMEIAWTRRRGTGFWLGRLMWISVRWSAMCCRRAELTGRCDQVIARTCHVTRHCVTCRHRVDSSLSWQWSRSGTWSIRPRRDLPDPKNQLPILCFQAVRPCVVRPSVHTYFAWRDISVLSGGISMKLGTNNHHVSGHC